MSFQIQKASLLALIQDYGRYGLQSKGITVGGPMDEHAFLWANRLLGNAFDAPQIEITMGAFAGIFHEPTKIALCGGDLGAELNREQIKPWQTHTIKAGDRLEFFYAHSGLRAYLAIKGGFKIKPKLGSVATVVREQLGGLNGDGLKLAVGDNISYEPSTGGVHVNRQVPGQFIPTYSSEATLRFFPNIGETGVAKDLVHRFVEGQYSLSPKIDRMGYRLKGEPLKYQYRDIISQGISLGAIQLPADGYPIILMSDRQTIGGYPQIGCVARVDMPILAQCPVGTRFKFVISDPIFMSHELRIRQKFMGTRR